MKLKQIKRAGIAPNTNQKEMDESKARSEYRRLQRIRSAIKEKLSAEPSDAAVQHMAVMLQNINSQLDTLKARLKLSAE